MTIDVRKVEETWIGTGVAYESWLSKPSGSYAEIFKVCKSDILARMDPAYVSFMMPASKASMSSMKSGSPRLALYLDQLWIKHDCVPLALP